MAKKKEDSKKSGGIQKAPSFKPKAKKKAVAKPVPKKSAKSGKKTGNKTEYDRFLVFDIGLDPASKKYKPLIPVIIDMEPNLIHI